MHIFYGTNFFYDKGYQNQTFFAANYTKAIISLLNKHQKKIILSLGAHVHFGDFRNPRSNDYPKLDSLLITTPSITPLFGNNPGYTILDVDSTTDMVTNFYLRYFALDLYIKRDKRAVWTSVYPQLKFNFNLNMPSSVESFVYRMQNDHVLFEEYVQTK